MTERLWYPVGDSDRGTKVYTEDTIPSVGTSLFTSSTSALSTTASIVLPERLQRSSAILLNTDAAIIVYIGDANVDSTYFPLRPGASITLTTTRPVYAVAASGTPTLAIFEEYN